MTILILCVHLQVSPTRQPLSSLTTQPRLPIRPLSPAPSVDNLGRGPGPGPCPASLPSDGLLLKFSV